MLDEPRYVEAAARAADFLLTRMRPDDRIRRAWKAGEGDGQLSTQGFLEDQSFVVQGLLDLFESRSDAPDGARWLREALALADAQERHFADAERGGWFMTANDAEVLIAREKPAYDGAEPSGTSVALLNALRLHTFTTDDRWRQVADRGFASVAARARAPAAGPDRGPAGPGLPPGRAPRDRRRPPPRRFRGNAGRGGAHDLRPQQGAGGGRRGQRVAKR